MQKLLGGITYLKRIISSLFVQYCGVQRSLVVPSNKLMSQVSTFMESELALSINSARCRISYMAIASKSGWS